MLRNEQLQNGFYGIFIPGTRSASYEYDDNGRIIICYARFYRIVNFFTLVKLLYRKRS